MSRILRTVAMVILSPFALVAMMTVLLGMMLILGLAFLMAPAIVTGLYFRRRQSRAARRHHRNAA